MLNNLDQKIILGNNINNLRKFIANYNLNNNIVLNYQLVTPKMLINELLNEYNELNNLSIRLIGSKEASFILYDLINHNDYGLLKLKLNVKSVNKLLDLINDYRLNEINSFKGIYEANYVSLINDYEVKLTELGLCDYITSFSLLKSFKKDLNVYVLNDLDLSKLEKRMIKSLFKDLIMISPFKANNKIIEVYESYGVYNELLRVVDVINSNHLSVNDCEVVYTNDVYENLARGLFDSLGIKYRLNKVHAKSTNLVSFMLDIIDYVRSDYKYELLEKILRNQGLDSVYLDEYYKTFAFPKVVVGFGYDRTKLLIDTISKDSNKTNICCFLNDLINCFDRDRNIKFDLFLSFVKKYINSENEKNALLDKISNISYLLNYETDKLALLKEELGGMSYSEVGEGLVLSKLNKSFSNKPYLFIIGLSQSFLNSYDTENPFIRDVDVYKGEFSDDANIHTLECLKKQTKECLDYYLNYSRSDIYLSYAYYNKIDMRDSAKSIYLINIAKGVKTVRGNLYDIHELDLLMGEKKVTKQIEEVVSYDNGIVNPDLEHLDNKDRLAIKEKKVLAKEDLFKMSPTAIKSMVDCSIKYYYQYLEKIADVQHQRLEEFEWLQANEKGTFFHRILELYAIGGLFKDNYKETIDEELFNNSFDIALKEALNRNAIRNEALKDIEIEQIKNVAYDYVIKVIDDFNKNPYRCLACEYDLTKGHLAKYSLYPRIVFSGNVDRIDGYLDKDILHLRIVDYKSGRFHDKQSDPYLQHILYPYAILNIKEKLFNLDYQKIVIDKFIYDYPFEEKENVYEGLELTSGDKYDVIFNNINELIIPYLEEKKGIVSKFIEKEVDTTQCKYCSYKDICIKKIKEGYNNE